jgi:hypothetical protein
MSGGSWNYAHTAVREAAERLQTEEDPNRKALGRLLERCADALHDIEWVDSNDYAPGQEFPAIRNAIDASDLADVTIGMLREAIGRAERVLAQLTSLSDPEKTE